MRVTRLAPSPTGALHLGNARTFLANWLLARQSGWRVLLRVEDLDGPRIKAGADRQAMEDLRWLGIDWDDGPIYQSARIQLYSDAIERLLSAGYAYPCVCSRREVELAASAPHAEDGAAVYPGTCRGRFKSVAEARDAMGRGPAVRFALPPGVIHFNDEFSGPHSIDVSKRLGDFVIAKSETAPAELGDPAARAQWAHAYQLAVVVDDAAVGVTDVVRSARTGREDAAVLSPAARGRPRRAAPRQAPRRHAPVLLQGPGRAAGPRAVTAGAVVRRRRAGRRFRPGAGAEDAARPVPPRDDAEVGHHLHER